MMISDGMVKRFIEANRMASGSAEFRVRAGLERALEGYELAPLVLSDAEKLALKVASGIAERGEPVGANTSTVLISALMRAQHTLAAPPQDIGLSGNVRVSQYQRLTDRIAELDTDRSAAYDLIAELQAQLQKHEDSIGWTGDQVVGIAELLEQIDIEDQFLSNPAVWRALLANYVEARGKTPEHAADIRGNCGLAGVSGEPAQAGGEWTLDEAQKIAVEYGQRFSDETGVEYRYSAYIMRGALNAVAPRVASPAIEPHGDAPTDIAALPDYWDERRKRQGKPDLSRCAAELRVALAAAAQAGGEWTEAERESASVALFTLRTAKEAWTAASARSLSDAALDAVKHKLAAPAIEPLSEGEESVLAYVEKYDAPKDAHVNGLVLAMRKRFPKPAPKPQTPDDLERIIRNTARLGSDSPEFNEALSKLVTLAEASK